MDYSEVAEMVQRGLTPQKIGQFYQRRYSISRGFSERSVRRFCHAHGVHKPKGDEHDEVVEESVKEV